MVLKRGMVGKTEAEISPAISAAISNLTRYVLSILNDGDGLRWPLTGGQNIRNNIARSARRYSLCKAFHSKLDKDKISEWKQELNRLMALFTVGILLVIFESFSPISLG